jgi:hypothetical protein
MKRFAAFLIAVAVLAAAPVMAQDPSHVKIAPNGKGDLLIFPFFYTDGSGLGTKITIINTSTKYSTVAKVVIKSYYYSQELRDFLIYLSPADVWTGYIVTFDGIPYIASYDDSVTPDGSTWASVDNLFMYPLVEATGDGDWNTFGYIHVINAATDQGGVLGTSPGIAKADIKKWYDSINTKGAGKVETKYNYPDDTTGKPTNNVPANVLSGWMEVTYNIFYNIAGLNATTLMDYQNTAYIEAVRETPLRDVQAKNTILDIEAALAKSEIAMPYVNFPFKYDDYTIHLFTFPTKEYHYLTKPNKDTIILPSPYFNKVISFDNQLACISPGRAIFNLSEKSKTGVVSPPPKAGKWCEEVHYEFAKNFPFSEGWAYYTFDDRMVNGDNHTIWNTPYPAAVLGYRGAPVIPTLFDITFGTVFTSLRYGTWTDGAVSLTVGQGRIYPSQNVNGMVNYHYSNIPTP